MNELEPRYLDTRQAAAYLGLSPKMLRRMRATGEGPPYARAGRRVIYDRVDLDDWIARQKRGFPPERPGDSEPGDSEPGEEPDEDGEPDESGD